MGTYLNPGSGNFQTALSSQIYVDKTGMIRYLNTILNTSQKYISISRPRRFGKTYAADMISAYYDRSIDSRLLFRHTDLAESEQWDRYLNRFDVIHLTITRFLKYGQSIQDVLTRIQKLVCRDLREAYPDVDYFDPDDLSQSMTDIYQKTGRPFVIVIDEWDAVFREYPGEKGAQRVYLDFLRNWLKDQVYVALAYITGILPIKKYGVHSALNMFREFSMLSPQYFARYTGFTDDEVRALCERYGRPFEQFRDWYDGYRVDGSEADPGPFSLYSPVSIVESVSSGRIGNYWSQTESFEALAEYINRNFDGLKEIIVSLMEGGRTAIEVSTYQNDMTTFLYRDDILTLLVHLGYLGYDADTKEVYIPNREVLDVFKASTRSQEWSASFCALQQSQKLLEATWAEDAEEVARLLEVAHEQAGTASYHSEAALSYAVQLAYYNARNYYTSIQELPAGKGYADLVYLPSPDHLEKPALLIELKYNREVSEAISQIHRQHYPGILEKYKGNILLVGISYQKDIDSRDAHFKHHSCIIERA